MSQPSDLEIARSVTPAPLEQLAETMGIDPARIEPYGRHVAKVPLDLADELADRPRARYVVVSAITPTPLGEGKTTTAVGLAQALARLGHRSVLTLRQPSMGPTFGIKGGAAGGGHSQVIPMERLNLALTGDFHAVTAAHNLLAALVDNHLHHGNRLGLDPDDISWRRVLDVNDRALRHIVVGLGGKADGVTRESGFDITAASEVMAILALATGAVDLRRRLGRIVVGADHDGTPVSAEDIDGAGAMAAILAEALQPNLLQTLEHTPVLVHAGPFGNIAHGNSSIIADLIGIRCGDYLVTEAGFGADMGAERFFNIKCRVSGLVPDAAVLVVTVRALKAHSGKHRIVAGRPLPAELGENRPAEVAAGAANLVRQVANIRVHGVTPVLAINVMAADHEAELVEIERVAAELGVRCARTRHFAEGGTGATELAAAVADAAAEPSGFKLLYADEDSLRAKIETIATEIYGADGVDYDLAASRQLDRYERLGYGGFPICVAKTHLSLSADPRLVGAPSGWRLPVRTVRASVGAGFVYPMCGDITTMPGLGSHPAAERIDVDGQGRVTGLS
ncbi:MAG: formate--tetrahydrofolate ligase [Acidimicrobiia bacterium]|nr:formate--tetrahydrofolate ligase [Acidimicrobiia bacterium]